MWVLGIELRSSGRAVSQCSQPLSHLSSPELRDFCLGQLKVASCVESELSRGISAGRKRVDFLGKGSEFGSGEDAAHRVGDAVRNKHTIYVGVRACGSWD